MNKRVAVILAVVLVALVLAEWAWAPHHHPVSPWHYWPGFSAAFAVIASLVLVTVSTVLGKAFLERQEKDDA